MATPVTSSTPIGPPPAWPPVAGPPDTTMNPEPPIDCQSPVLDYLQSLHAELATVTEGTVATYIPELAKADPRWFGICLVTPAGRIYAIVIKFGRHRMPPTGKGG